MATSSSDSATRAGIAALQMGDAATARRAFEAALADRGGTPQLWLYLAHSCMIVDDPSAADEALDRVLAQEPRNLYALCMKGDLAVNLGDDRSAASYFAFALANAPSSGLSADLIERLRAAEMGVAAAQARFRERLGSAVDRSDPHQPERFRDAIAIVMGESPVYLQQPTSFYYPGLAATPFFDTADIPWIAALERAGPAMRAELDALLAEDAGFQPYVRAESGRPNRGHVLLDDPRWSALHLMRSGVRVAGNADRCPATMAALGQAPLPHIRGRSPMALFSMLRPHTHIPPHTGLLNTRLICHIPLVVPDGCRLRVGNRTRIVEPFKAMLFDDSIEHEAWNDSDEVRVVLLFEVWRPDLCGEERGLLTRMFEAIGTYED